MTSPPLSKNNSAPPLANMHASFPSSLHIASIKDSSNRVIPFVKAVYDQKKHNKNKSIENPLRKWDPTMITGDVANMLFPLLQTLPLFSPPLSSSSVFSITSCALGSVIGVINIGVGVISFYEARQAHKGLTKTSKNLLRESRLWTLVFLFLSGRLPEDLEKCLRLYWDGFFLILLGSLITLVSLSAKIGAFAGVGAFFAIHSWIIPLVWTLISIPLVLEVWKNNQKILKGSDLGSKMLLDSLTALLEKETVDWSEIDTLCQSEGNPFDFTDIEKQCDKEDAKKFLKELENEAIRSKDYKPLNLLQEAFRERFNQDEKVNLLELIENLSEDDDQTQYLIECLMIDKISQRTQELQINIGAESAVTALKLKYLLMKRDPGKALAKVKVLQKKLGKWNFIQKWRLAQQLLLTLCSVTAFLSLIGSAVLILNTITNALIFIGNTIPLILDSFCPFERNIYIVVALAALTDVIGRISTVADNQKLFEHISQLVKTDPTVRRTLTCVFQSPDSGDFEERNPYIGQTLA